MLLYFVSNRLYGLRYIEIEIKNSVSDANILSYRAIHLLETTLNPYAH